MADLRRFLLEYIATVVVVVVVLVWLRVEDPWQLVALGIGCVAGGLTVARGAYQLGRSSRDAGAR